MKKAAKAILIVFAVIIIALIITAVLNRRYISILLTGITNNSETIKEKQKDTNDNLINELNNFLDEKLREPTDEENIKIENGELDIIDLYHEIISERIGKDYEYNIETKEMTEKEQEKPENEDANNDEEPHTYSEKDTVVSEYISRIYALQSAYSSKIEAFIPEAAAYYNDLRATQDKSAARANTISHFSSIAASLEDDCDKQFEQVISELTDKLKEMGEDTDITKAIKKSYEEEKELKISYYINQYVK